MRSGAAGSGAHAQREEWAERSPQSHMADPQSRSASATRSSTIAPNAARHVGRQVLLSRSG
jgi:hypothetical protein